MKKKILYSGYFLLCFFVIGILTLDANYSTSNTSFLALIIFLAWGWGSRKWLTVFPSGEMFLLFSVPIVCFFIIGLIMAPEIWYKGPLPCFLAYTIGFWMLSGKKSILMAPLFLVVFYYSSYTLSPANELIYHKALNPGQKINFRNTQVKFLGRDGIDVLPSLKGKYLVIETWNEYCGYCFSAMKDLHPVLTELESRYPELRHIYLYSYDTEKSKFSSFREIFSDQHLPYKSLPIFFDYDRNFMKKIMGNEATYPAFIIIDTNGQILKVFTGYNSNYKNFYTQYFRRLIAKSIR